MDLNSVEKEIEEIEKKLEEEFDYYLFVRLNELKRLKDLLKNNK